MDIKQGIAAITAMTFASHVLVEAFTHDSPVFDLDAAAPALAKSLGSTAITGSFGYLEYTSDGISNIQPYYVDDDEKVYDFT